MTETYMKEWENLINELAEKEIALWKWKETYQIKSDEIIANTDFKALYGANNQTIRNNHVKNELADWYTTIKELEISINWITNRISFLRELIKCKRTVLEVKAK